jgi:pimeloyl-ACP methyl ester carboxylesterase
VSSVRNATSDRRLPDGVQLTEPIGPARIELAYQRLGDPNDPPVLLVMGLATQMIGWPDGFCEELVGRGLHVIRFDNRDVGLSTHLRDAPTPDLQAAFSGDKSSAVYVLSDMAADTVGLLDALGLDRVHVVGASLGGMIAQTVAIEHPQRVSSLVSIMSTTGGREVGHPTPEGLAALMSPPPRNRNEAMDRAVSVFRAIGSPGFPLDQQAVRERAGIAYDRANDPAGVARQLAAILASPDRTPGLGSVVAPTLVVHGAADALVDVSGGRATADAVPGASLLVVDGMGHDLPAGLWQELATRIAEHVYRVEGVAG